MPPAISPTSKSGKAYSAKRPRARKVVTRTSSPKHTGGVGGEMNYKRIWLAGPIERIGMVKAGLPAVQAKQIIADLHMPITRAGSLGHMPVSTLNRKVKNDEVLAPDASERFLGLAKLIGQVQAMVEESGDGDGFDAKAWTARWLKEPLPAFGGAAPIEMMDTMEGQALVSAVLARMQSGAYA